MIIFPKLLVDQKRGQGHDPQSHQEAQAVPLGRFGQEGRLPAIMDASKMDHADPKLEGSDKPVYH